MDCLRDWTSHWSDLWQMLAALGTLLAVAVAIWATVRESKARKAADERAEKAEQALAVERERADAERAAELEERRLAQAKAVIAWVEHRPAVAARPHHTADGLRPLGNEHILRVVNDSASPIFDLHLHVWFKRMNTDEEIHALPVLPGGVSVEVVFPERLQEAGFEYQGLVRFRDLAGQRWRRWENGHLNEMDDNWRETFRCRAGASTSG